MKRISVYIVIAFVLISCGSENSTVEDVIASKNLETIRSKRADLTKELKTLEDQVTLLDEAIAVLDDNAKLPLVTTMEVVSQNFDHYLEIPPPWYL